LDIVSDTDAKAELATIAQRMPLTTDWVKQRRREWGNEYVTGMIRRGMQGERNCFYAIEAGHFIGTPFDWNEKLMFAVSMSVLTGAKFIAGMRDKNNQVLLQICTPPERKQP
jgi:hypothetical protein